MQPFEMTEEFHETFDPRKPAIPTPFDQKEAQFRAGFKAEELVEFLFAACKGEPAAFNEAVTGLHQAIEEGKEKILKKEKTVTDPLVDEVDALVDVLYLTYGSFSLMGVDPQPIMEIVHQANMGKLFPDGKPHYHPVTNKVMKPADWEERFAPEGKIKAELARQVRKVEEAGS